MSASMHAMCSIQEGHVKGGLQESPCRALQGNQKTPTVSYKQSTFTKWNHGIYGLLSYYGWDTPSGATPFATPYDAATALFARYATQTDIGYDSGGSTIYTGTSDFQGAGYCPQASGFPSGGTGLTGNQYIFAQRFPPDGTQTMPVIIGSIDTSTLSDSNADLRVPGFFGGYIAINQTVGTTLDFSGDWTTLKSDALAVTWNWSVAAFNKGYNEPYQTCRMPYTCVVSGGFTKTTQYSSESDVSSLTPASYDMSIIDPALATPVLPDGPFVTGSCCNGWCITGGTTFDAGSFMVALLGLAKNTTTIDQPYFIGRMRMGANPSADFQAATVGHPKMVGSSSTTSGVTYTAYILDLIETGMIKAGKVIGYNQTALDADNKDMAFPSTAPFPLIDLGDSACVYDLYFAVIGQDPAGWAAMWNFQFGTITATTP